LEKYRSTLFNYYLLNKPLPQQNYLLGQWLFWGKLNHLQYLDFTVSRFSDAQRVCCTVVGIRKVQASFLFHTHLATVLFDINNRQPLRRVVGVEK
jgi:hypothetical protein